MRWQRAAVAVSSVFFAQLISAQTYSKCNPLEQSCPADPALGGSAEFDFSSGPSSEFTPTGNGVSYNSAGAQLAVAGQGDNPTLSSKWYIMFGHVDMVFKAAPGVGMVSSAILISDDLDEIDWELLGADSTQAQTNYFGKGVTGSYDRGGFSATPNSQTEFNTYSIDWTAERIEWQFNGETVRTLSYADANGQYPQTPMQVKVGSWAGGDSSNSQGVIEWAGGPIDYSGGPYVMQVQSISATDYSTGSAYQYSGTDGSWQQVQAIGGQIKSSGTPNAAPSTPDSPPVPDANSDSPQSVYATRTGWPWVASTGSVSLATSKAEVSSYLESVGYNSGSHPSKTPAPPSPTPASPPSSSDSSPGGCDVISAYDQQGFPVTMTVPVGYKPTYENSGALKTPPPCKANAAATSLAPAAYVPVNTPAVTSAPVFNGGSPSTFQTKTLSALQTQEVKPAAQPDSSTPAPYKPGNGATQPSIPFMGGAVTCAMAVLVAAFL